MPLGPAGVAKLIAEEDARVRLVRGDERHGFLARAEHVQHLLEARRLQDQANVLVDPDDRQTPAVPALAPCATERGEGQRVDEAHLGQVDYYAVLARVAPLREPRPQLRHRL